MRSLDEQKKSMKLCMVVSTRGLHVSVFFQFIALFALFFGIAGIVYGTEVSKRCQQRINDRFAEIEIKMSRRNKDHEEIIKKAVLSLRNMMEKLEETELSQSREIIAISKSIKPLVKDFELREEHRKKREKIRVTQRRG